jgi:F-type H+-transporting ATPase subunit epsilon
MHVDVVTPRGRLVSEEADEVTAPGVLGEFGVLPGHIPFLTALRPGVLRWRSATGGGVLAVGPGFVEVAAGDRVVVLAEVGAKVAEIDGAAVAKERDEAQAKLDHWESEDAGLRADVQAQRDWAQARLDAAQSTAH